MYISEIRSGRDFYKSTWFYSQLLLKGSFARIYRPKYYTIMKGLSTNTGNSLRLIVQVFHALSKTGLHISRSQFSACLKYFTLTNSHFTWFILLLSQKYQHPIKNHRYITLTYVTKQHLLTSQIDLLSLVFMRQKYRIMTWS